MFQQHRKEHPGFQPENRYIAALTGAANVREFIEFGLMFGKIGGAGEQHDRK
jgi:hypothetical protein